MTLLTAELYAEKMIDLWCAFTPKDIGHFMEPRPQPLFSSLAFLLHSPSIGSSAVVHKYHRAIAYLPVPGILPVCGIHVGEFPHGSLATITTHYRMSGFQPRLAASKPTSHRSIKNSEEEKRREFSHFWVV